MPWQPGRRRAARALEEPYENVPAHLALPLWGWIDAAMNWDYGSDTWRDVALALRLDLTDQPRRFFMKKCESSSELMLDVVEALLELKGWQAGGPALDALLERANSAYTVRNDYRGLELRIAPGVRDLVQQTVSEATGSAGAHLTAAWNAAYGRKPDPAKSYAEAIKAAEAALAQHVAPQNSRQTLGTMIANIRDAPHKWTFSVGELPAPAPDVETVLRMMQSLWTGQTSRHGGTAPTRLETIDEARAAVHLAAALVQFGTSGAFTRVEPR